MNPHKKFRLKDCSAIILVGGKSSRMKTDKKKLEVGGISLLDRAVSNLSGIFTDTLVSVSGNGEETRTGIRIVPDSPEGGGPLSGIYSGLKHSKTGKNFVMAVDIPDISLQLISEMYNFSADFDIVIPCRPDGKAEPLFGFYKKQILSVIRENLKRGKNKVVDIYSHVRVKHVLMQDTSWLFNINTEEDLRLYLKHSGLK